MTTFLKNNFAAATFIALIAAVIFIPFIGNCPLFDWDEVNFAECAREMVTSGNYSLVQLNYRPFWEKPPLFIWLQAASMNLFGVNEFAARFPNAICSIVSLVSIFMAGKKFHSIHFGALWSFLYAATLLPHLYFKSGLIDPWFNLFIFLSLYHCIQFLNNPSGKKQIVNALVAGLFLGLAVLTKGPAALVIVALTLGCFILWNRQFGVLLSRSFLIFVVTTLFISGSWFLIEYLKGNGKLISEFVTYQLRLFETGDSGHDGPFIYHFVVLLLGCFPASLIFIISYLKYSDLTPYQRLYRKLFICLFWVVLILFSVVKTKIVHYSSLCYFPLTFVAGIGLVNYFSVLKFNGFLKTFYWLITGLFTVAFVAIGLINYIKPWLLNSGLIADEFAVQNLQAEVHWTGFESLIAVIFLLSSWLIYKAITHHKTRLLYYGLAANLLFIYLAIAVIIPKVELYTQHAAIAFYKAHAGPDCYVETHGFKSYAYLFYSARRPGDYNNPDQVAFIEQQLDKMVEEGHSRFTSFSTANLLWMENGKIDRPAFIVVKTIQEQELLGTPGFKKLYSQNGFSFFVRMPAK
ncbi:MAG: glycosyltransferase family 39 protein [Bacteroidota bacterium]